jgi:hypothetical protein
VVSRASSKVSGARIEGQPLGEHGLAGAGRADHKDVVAAGSGHFERALGRLLAAHIFEVDGEVLQLAEQISVATRKGSRWMTPTTGGVEQVEDIDERGDG